MKASATAREQMAFVARRADFERLFDVLAPFFSGRRTKFPPVRADASTR